jgi:thioredoxin-related protein
MPRSHVLPAFGLVTLVFATSAGQSHAQEVRWRDNYDAARREATETGKPLLLDFGTEACVWCRKLDATTFRDPKVVKLLNERFIAVKIDANRYMKLTTALGIESYPTLVLATADGKVAGRHVGYATVPELMTLLNKAPAPQPVQPPAQPMVQPIAAVPAVQPMPTQPQPASQPSQWRRLKEQIDADLAALHPKIATALER